MMLAVAKMFAIQLACSLPYGAILHAWQACKQVCKVKPAYCDHVQKRMRSTCTLALHLLSRFLNLIQPCIIVYQSSIEQIGGK